MTLIEAILKKVRSQEQLSAFKQPSSPPPEIDSIVSVGSKKKRKYVYKYSHVSAAVDTSPPALDPRAAFIKLLQWTADFNRIMYENRELVKNIKRAHFTRGKVDSRWEVEPERTLRYYYNRLNFWKRVDKENKQLYRRINSVNAKVDPCWWLERQWQHMRRKMVTLSRMPFVLFHVEPRETVEDLAFVAPQGVHRPRVRLWLKVRNRCHIGWFDVELFTEQCPNTCSLFMELVLGDTGYSYIGTKFFRKVPPLFWSGGDVVYDCGCGCYAPRGLTRPIGAENYHFPHSMPGLLSMQMTGDDEMCGIFNITFKPLPQFDLKNVVFGRVVRPSATYDTLSQLGSPLKPQPVVEIYAAKLKVNGKWARGKPNTKIVDTNDQRWRRERGDLQHHRAQKLGLV